MKRIIMTLAAALAFAIGAQAQLTREIGFYYQSGQFSVDNNNIKDNQLGFSVLFQMEPFYPSSIYVSTGLEGSMGINIGDAQPDFRIELPVKLSFLYEPSPDFSIGPYAGVYGASCMIFGDVDTNNYNTLQYGICAGISLRPEPLFINVGYFRDLRPYHVAGTGISGIRVMVGYFW